MGYVLFSPAAPTRRRTRRRILAALTAMVLVGVGCASSSKASGTSDTSGGSGSADAKVLGPDDPAKGAPVKVGVISDGKFATADRAYEADVAAATVKYLNQHKGGLGGRPIKLVTCIEHGDPAQAADCGNQMVEKNVVAVAYGSPAVIDQSWRPIHDAHIPTILYGASSAKVVSDGQSTFVLSNPTSGLVDLPASVAKKVGEKKVTVVVIDIPAAVSIYKTIGPSLFKQYGVKLDVVAIPPDTADMTPQMQRLASGDPGVVHVIGTDSFCIAAFNGLRAVNFNGTVTSISQCFTDATLKAVPGSFLKGIKISTTAPVENDMDPSIRLYDAVIRAYAHGTPRSKIGALSMFTTVAALNVATEGMTGPVTPARLAAAIKAMPERPLPGSGEQQFRCNSKATTFAPAICVRSGLVTTLDEHGHATTYEKVNDTPIED